MQQKISQCSSVEIILCNNFQADGEFKPDDTWETICFY